jgi:GntR family transcriptional repressor for pyruvate dehydrogenase complex
MIAKRKTIDLPEKAMRKNQQPYERVVGTLIRQIFFNHVKPGAKLPTERQLAQDMNVDRSSLRVALKHLESMGVLNIRQGDGIYIRDYLKHAGIEFIAALFNHMEYDQPETNFDEYIMEEIWEFWIGVMPEMLKLALQRFSPRGVKAMMDILEDELRHISDKEKIVDCELLSQDIIAETANNTMYLLLSNTNRSLRRRMIELYVYSVDEETIRKHIETKKDLFKKFMRMDDRSHIHEIYREVLKALGRKVTDARVAREEPKKRRDVF